VLFAATGSAFLICRYDPFVAFFRLSGSLNMVIIGVCFLIVGMFVGRPYCRFFCPYGMILRQLSRLSKWRVTITPDECIQCRLCEESCPFGAVRKPTVEWSAAEYTRAKTRLVRLIVLVPILALLCGWGGASLKNVTARMHSRVQLAERIFLEEAGKVQDTTDASSAFRATGAAISDLYAEASGIRRRFTIGGWLLGAFTGLVISLKLTSVSVWRRREDYEADRAGCLACARCYKYCPRERLRHADTTEVIE